MSSKHLEKDQDPSVKMGKVSMIRWTLWEADLDGEYSAGGSLGNVLRISTHWGREGTTTAPKNLGSDEIPAKTSAGSRGSSGAGDAKLAAERLGLSSPTLAKKSWIWVFSGRQERPAAGGISSAEVIPKEGLAVELPLPKPEQQLRKRELCPAQHSTVASALGRASSQKKQSTRLTNLQEDTHFIHNLQRAA